jgi:pyruvate, water dikinase
MQAAQSYIRWFQNISLKDIEEVGGKNASLGELHRQLSPLGVPVPNGFAITARAYRDLLRAAGALDRLRETLAPLGKNVDMMLLGQQARQARAIVYQAGLPEALKRQILEAYRKLKDESDGPISVAVRSSATAEDLPTASFAGQHDSFLNVRGEEELLEACRLCFASVFTERAIVYRLNNSFDHFKVALSIGVQRMVRSDLAASGVMFTLDTESGFDEVVFITAAYGLGEYVVQGKVAPDEFYVHKPTFRAGHRAVLRRRLGGKAQALRYGDEGGASLRTTEVTAEHAARFCIRDEDVLRLAEYALKIEQHYSAQAGRPCPMDIEWAQDGIDGGLYIIQARPETVVSRRPRNRIEKYRLAGKGEVLLEGRAVGTQIASGRIRRIASPEQLPLFRPGEILLAEDTNPDWVPVMKQAAAIITDRGGRTCHAAIVARELGIPAVVGAGDATRRLGDGVEVTVSCAGGETGRVYAGALPFTVDTVQLDKIALPATDIMLNVGTPDRAFTLQALPNAGVGLARIEFIITEYIKAHPMALIHPERVSDPAAAAQLRELTRHYASGVDFFVEKLSEGVATIAAAFYPKPVIVRMSDFKTNEYASLLGGRDFEPAEHNPMLGFRGASRYAHPAYAEGFALECAAMRRVREDMGFTNVKLMIPFCRRVDEAERVLQAMARQGLAQGRNGLEIYVMCEIPNNVIQVDAFAKLFDGFSIGSNDLTQLVLGIDRDSELLAGAFDERDPGVLELIRQAIAGAHRHGRKIGICGQAPSDYPEYARFLVENGIDSISLNPDSVPGAIERVAGLERERDANARKTAGA